jgi:hypothetical protein
VSGNVFGVPLHSEITGLDSITSTGQAELKRISGENKSNLSTPKPKKKNHPGPNLA